MPAENKVLIASQNTMWAKELRDYLVKSKELDAIICSTRSDVVERINQKAFNLIVIENSFDAKTTSFILRAIANLELTKVTKVFLCSTSIDFFAEVSIDDSIKDRIEAFSLPLKKELIAEIIFSRGVKSANLEDQELNMGFAETVIYATKEIIEGMAFSDCKFKKPELLDGSNYPEIAIRSIIDVESEYFTGQFIFSFPKETFLSLYEKILGEKISVIDESVEDLVSSIANMVYGRIKKVLSEDDVQFNMAIPFIDKSEKIDFYKSPVFLIPFESDFGDFYLKIVSAK